MADIELDNLKGDQDPQECLYTGDDAADITEDSLRNDDYPSGVPLVLNVLAVGLATVLIGYVSLLQPTLLSSRR